MQIANGPADAGRRGWRHVERDLDHGFRLLRDDVARSRGLPEHVAVPQWRRQLEAELRAVLRRAAPEPLHDREPFDPQPHLRQSDVWFRDWGVDQLKHGEAVTKLLSCQAGKSDLSGQPWQRPWAHCWPARKARQPPKLVISRASRTATASQRNPCTFSPSSTARGPMPTAPGMPATNKP